MESKSLINFRWPNKLHSVVGSCLYVDNYVIMQLGSTHPHISLQSHGQWSRWNIHWQSCSSPHGGV